MSAKRSYCLADKPFPVSARALLTLAHIGDAMMETYQAPAQIERLRRGGYVRIVGGWAQITDAGRALLARGRGR